MASSDETDVISSWLARASLPGALPRILVLSEKTLPVRIMMGDPGLIRIQVEPDIPTLQETR